MSEQQWYLICNLNKIEEDMIDVLKIGLIYNFLMMNKLLTLITLLCKDLSPLYMSFIGPCVGVVGHQLDPGAV